MMQINVTVDKQKGYNLSPSPSKKTESDPIYQDITIRQLAELVKETIGFEGEIVFDTTKPDGTPRKLMDVGLINRMGWHSRTTLQSGLAHADLDFKQSIKGTEQ